MMLPLATETWDEDEIVAIRRVVASKRFTMGPEVQAFEEEIAAFQRGTACGNGELRLFGQPACCSRTGIPSRRAAPAR
jgi:hypothetical protein